MQSTTYLDATLDRHAEQETTDIRRIPRRPPSA